MPKEFRGLLSGEISRIDSKTEFTGKSISNSTRRAVVVSPHDDNHPQEEIVEVEGKSVRVTPYRIYILEAVGNSELGTLIYPMPGTVAETEYLNGFPKEEQEYQRKQLLMSSTKIGYFKRGEHIGETVGYGSEVFASPIQEGLLSDRFFIVPTGIKQKLNGSHGLAPSRKLNPDFSKLPGQESFFNENGKAVNSITAGNGTVSLLGDNTNYSCLTDEVKQKINELANAGFDLVITSAYRTAEDSARVGSDTSSYHNTGLAVDFRVENFEEGGQLNTEGQRLVETAMALGFSYPVGIDHGTGKHFHFEYRAGSPQSRQECSEEALSSFYEEVG